MVGEVRGAEALDLLNALDSGHSGTMTTLHASTATQALSKLETLVLSAGEDLLESDPLPDRQARSTSSCRLRASGTDSAEWFRSPRCSPRLDEHGSYRVRYLYRYRTHGISPEGQIQGRLEPTGLLPSFFEEAKDQGLDISPRDFGLEEESNEFNEVLPRHPAGRTELG